MMYNIFCKFVNVYPQGHAMSRAFFAALFIIFLSLTFYSPKSESQEMAAPPQAQASSVPAYRTRHPSTGVLLSTGDDRRQAARQAAASAARTCSEKPETCQPTK
jgi:hypothetical protein